MKCKNDYITLHWIREGFHCSIDEADGMNNVDFVCYVHLIGELYKPFKIN